MCPEDAFLWGSRRPVVCITKVVHCSYVVVSQGPTGSRILSYPPFEAFGNLSNTANLVDCPSRLTGPGLGSKPVILDPWICYEQTQRPRIPRWSVRLPFPGPGPYLQRVQQSSLLVRTPPPANFFSGYLPRKGQVSAALLNSVRNSNCEPRAWLSETLFRN